MAAFKLYYFPLRGRAELTRLLFAASGKKFQDVRIPKSEWPGKKKSFPNGTLPMLEVNGQRLTHSIAIAKYVARTFGLSGKTDMERGVVDQIVFTGNDLLEKYIQYYVQQDLQQKEKMLKLLIDDYAPNILETFDNWLRENDGGNGYFVGSSLTLADLAIYEDVTSVLFQDKTILEKHPKLMAHRNRIEETPKIKEYLEKRQWTDI